MGLYFIENAPCYFICQFSDAEWEALEKKMRERQFEELYGSCPTT